ncbi:MAG: SGNH/GDSL hydrolase family protein [Caldimonas sp.]
MRLNASNARRRALVGVALFGALLAASCGGGDQVNSFSASRVIALGDETSVIDDYQGNGNGRKYSVNATVSETDPTLDCAFNPLWVQSLATHYGLVFPQCNKGANPVPSPRSRIRAMNGARAADLAAQIDAQIAESPIGTGDLVSVLVGENDVLAQYATYPSTGEPQLIANVEAAGAEVARQVNRLADFDARIVVSTIPDVGVTPYALAERAAHADIDRAALLTRMSARFNASLRATLINDGRRVGLVVFDELISVVARYPGLNGFVNTTTGACDLSQSMLVPPSILDCTSLTLVDGASGLSNLWADDRHVSAGAQLSLGTLAVDRAQRNPF